MAVAIIAGSGIYQLRALERAQAEVVSTPYGGVELVRGELGGRSVVFLPRHGVDHRVPPHLINYRANLWAVRAAGAVGVLAVNAVGGIDPRYPPGTLALPDQLIDYSWGRPGTYADTFAESPLHIEFAEPFAGPARAALRQALVGLGQRWIDGGTYGVTQGPRLETRAEIARLARDGCHIVGMTALPEAALARELELSYGSICPVVNWAAGVGPADPISVAAVMAQIDALVPVIESALAEAVSVWPS